MVSIRSRKFIDKYVIMINYIKTEIKRIYNPNIVVESYDDDTECNYIYTKINNFSMFISVFYDKVILINITKNTDPIVSYSSNNIDKIFNKIKIIINK